MNDEERATWTAAYINNLPDSAFLVIESGGKKDDEGKTVPRSLRHFPVHDANGNVDLPHLRNALARIPQSDLSAALKSRAESKAQAMLKAANQNNALPDDDFEVRGTDLWPDADFELRTEGDGLTLSGYAAVYGLPSEPIPGGPRGTFTETIRAGAFARTLARNPDVTLRYQHNLTTLPLARTKSGTLQLSEDQQGLRVQAQLPDNEIGRPVRDAIQRGDISGMSFRFRVPSKAGEKWSADYKKRELLDVALGGEVSVVDFPAYPSTTVAVRQLAELAEVEPDELAEAFDMLRTDDGKLSPQQHKLLQQAIAAKAETPYISPTKAKLGEWLAAHSAKR
jgi:Escherichia/Staphylococcus phage prohead protease